MPEFVERVWNPTETAALSRRDRAPGRYRAFVPDELARELPELSPNIREVVEDALTAIARADERIGVRGGYLNHLLVRSESISSSWIEGNRITPKRLAIAEVLQHGSRAALDVIANVHATELAIADLAHPQRQLTIEDIVRLQHVIEPSLAPGIRSEQNWVGGSGWSPLRADFVPPPETEVVRLLANLATFASATSGNPLVRAAIAHAQFETIHPFVDGNGRTGRALIHTVLRRTDALRNIILPISTVFAGRSSAYIAGLTAYRAIPSRTEEWIEGFAQACVLAADNAVRLANQVDVLDVELETRLVSYRASQGLSPAVPRKDAVSLRVLRNLSSEPVVTAQLVTETFGVSTTAAHRALDDLHQAGILARTKDQKGRLLCFSSDEHLNLVALTERSNRVGAGDTRHVRPKRDPAPPSHRLEA